MIDYFSYLLLNKIILLPWYFYNLRCMAANSERHSAFFVKVRKDVCKQLTSLLVSRV